MGVACLQCEWVEGYVSSLLPEACFVVSWQWLQTQSHRTTAPKAHTQNCTYRPCCCRFGFQRLRGLSISMYRKSYQLFRFHAWLLPRLQLSPFRRVPATQNKIRSTSVQGYFGNHTINTILIKFRSYLFFSLFANISKYQSKSIN